MDPGKSGYNFKIGSKSKFQSPEHQDWFKNHPNQQAENAMWYNPDHRSGDTHWKPKTKRLNKQRLNSTALHYNLALDINKK